MTNEDRPIDPQRLADFGRVLRQRGVETLTCPACGTRDAWGGFADVGVNVLAGRNPDTGTIEGFHGAVHAMLAVCGTCGYMALFDRDVIGE